MRISVVLPEPLGPSRPTMPPRSISNETFRRTGCVDRRRLYENDSSVAFSIVHHDVERPAAGSLNVSVARDSNRRRKERRVCDDGVVLAALAAWIDAEPCEFRQQIGAERTT